MGGDLVRRKINPLIDRAEPHAFRVEVMKIREDWQSFASDNFSPVETGPRSRFWGLSAAASRTILLQPDKSAQLERGKALYARSAALRAQAHKEFNAKCLTVLASSDYLGLFMDRASVAGLAPA